MTSSGMNGLAIQVVVQEAYVSDLHQTIMCKVAVDMCGGVKLSSLTWNFICGPRFPEEGMNVGSETL